MTLARCKHGIWMDVQCETCGRGPQEPEAPVIAGVDEGEGHFITAIEYDPVKVALSFYASDVAWEKRHTNDHDCDVGLCTNCQAPTAVADHGELARRVLESIDGRLTK